MSSKSSQFLAALLLGGAVMISSNAGAQPEAAYAAVFSMSETSESSAYSEKLNLAYSDLAAGRLGEALAGFEDADAMLLSEGHRYELLPQIAYLNLVQGDHRAAQRSIRLANGAYELLTGTATCVEEDNAVWRVEGLGVRLSAVDRSDLASRMCDAFLDPRVSPDGDGLFLTKLKIVENLSGR